MLVVDSVEELRIEFAVGFVNARHTEPVGCVKDRHKRNFLDCMMTLGPVAAGMDLTEMLQAGMMMAGLDLYILLVVIQMRSTQNCLLVSEIH